MRMALALAAGVWSPAAMAEVAPTDADVAALVAALETRGCLVVDYNDPAILEESKLDSDVANAIIAKLVESGEISFVEDGMQLKTPNCVADFAAVAPDAPSEPIPAGTPDQAAFVALMEAHDCKLSFDEAGTVLEAAGFTPENANPMMEAMAAEGQLELGQNEMTLKSGNCQ
jgi:hypothetical protein